jgi:hypothetical protein
MLEWKKLIFSSTQAFANTVNKGVGFTQHLYINGSQNNLTQFYNAVDRIYAQNFVKPIIRIPLYDIETFPRTNINSFDIDCNATSPVNCNPANLNIYLQAVSYAKSKGLKVLMVTNVPSFAKLYSDPVNPWEVKYNSSTYFSISRDYYTNLVTKFGNMVDVYQIFNEANIHVYDNYNFVGTNLINDNKYFSQLSRIVKDASNIVKANNGQAKVMVNAGGYPFNTTTFNSWLTYFDKMVGFVDEIGLDIYPDDNQSSINMLVSSINTIIARYPNDKVSITEIGMCTDFIRFDEVEQGQFIDQYLTLISNTALQDVYVYQMTDNDTLSAPCENNFGIVRANNTEKASYTQVMTRLGTL